MAAWDRHLVHRSLPRTLASSLRTAGFAGVELTGHSFTSAEFTPDGYGAALIGVMENYLLGLDDFPAADARAWAAEQRALGDRGEYYFACIQCCVTATRPETAAP
jgi:hypothetical protein